ncbi:unnamed protein product [Linum tenue]|uniref:VPS9 domain-containing protein n=1 Tax=Linum tenue TaxID=586396 RepID=A0AAV0MHA0_9ROSI|nr:unnamed protein product [Linum tenue]
METAFRAHPLWAGCKEEELESAGEGLEKYVMTKLFTRVFASLPDDVKADEQLSEKMSLIQHFVRPENLDIKPSFENETSWLLAQKELQKINMCKAPRDKLVCILNCCKVINHLLLNASIASNENPPGADEFLPVLIYVTITSTVYTCKVLFSYMRRQILHSCTQICCTYSGIGVNPGWWGKQHIFSQICCLQSLSSLTLPQNLSQWKKPSMKRIWNWLEHWSQQVLQLKRLSHKVQVILSNLNPGISF